MTLLTDIKSSVISAAGAGLTVYATKEDLPTSGLTSGDQAYVTANSRLYVSNGSGWYNVALINATPSLSIDPTGTIVLSVTGETTTITLTATDSDNAVDGISFSVDSDGSFAGLGTISQDSSVFTITPLSEDSATTTSATLTFKASDGISFGSGDRTLTLSFKVENSNYTTLLFKNEETSDNQVDASTNAFTITENGNVTSTAFSPYHPGGYSAEFVSGINYIHVDNDVSSVQWMYNGSTAEGTFEAWIYQKAQGTGNVAYTFPSILGNGATYFNFGVDNAQLKFYYWVGSAVTAAPSGATISLNKWHHVAISNDSSNNFRIFLDGVLVHTITSWPGITWSAASGGDDIYIGIEGANNATSSFTGFIRDARMLQGTCLYTSTFTPPNQPLTAITNTEWLFCHAPYIKDGSTNNVVVTDNYGVATARFGPYDYLGYTKADHGGSVYFDGTGDWLTISNSSEQMVPEAGDFTVEFWFYTANASTRQDPYSSHTASTGWAVSFSLTTAGDITPYYGNSTPNQTAGGQFKANVWNHFAMAKSGTTLKMFMNGKTILTDTNDTRDYSGTSDLYIGAAGNQTYPYTGWISDARFVKGTAVYTSDFTPPTQPLTAITNTQLLTCTNKNDIWDASASPLGLITVGGTAAASNTQRKFTSSSAIAYDGNSDYLQIPANDFFNFGTDDFTMETWVYAVATSNNYPAFMSSITGWSAGANGHRFDNTGYANKFAFYVNGFGGRSSGNPFMHTTNNFSHDTWYHYAVTRSGSTFRMFIDGVLEDTQTSSGSLNIALGGFRSGWSFDGAGGYFNGYVQDMRITRGVARYTATFTPPTAEFDG